MRRRTLMISAGATALTAAAVAPAFAQKVRTLKFGYILPQESQLGAGAKVFEAEVATRTAGRYRIEQYPNATLGGEVEMLKALQLGTIDAAFITGAPLPNFVLEVGVFNIPFIFQNVSHAHSVLDGPIGLACLEKFRDKDLVALAWGENGMRQITNSKRPIRTPEDLKGLKLRLPQSKPMMIGFQALGADVSTLPFPELFGALQSGRFDGQENPIGTIQAAKFWQVQKYLTLSNHVYDPAVILMSTDAFGDLSDADKVAFAAAATQAGQASRRYSAEVGAKGVETLAQAGMEVVREIDRRPFLAALEPAQPKFNELFGANLISFVQHVS